MTRRSRLGVGRIVVLWSLGSAFLVGACSGDDDDSAPSTTAGASGKGAGKGGASTVGGSSGTTGAGKGGRASGGTGGLGGTTGGGTAGRTGGRGGSSGTAGSDTTTGGSAGDASCPSSCDDSNACTKDTSSGNAAECSLTCSHDPITACADGDGCCPSGCDEDSDGDCASVDFPTIPDDRKVAWKPGIPGGIPTRNDVCTTIDADEYGDGQTDARGAIQDALDSCPDNGVVMLPAGEYRLSDALHLNHSVVLRGAGPSATKLMLQSGDVVVEIGQGAQNNIPGVNVTDGFTKGSTSITVADASDFNVGDVVLIDQLDDGDEVVTGDCEYFKRWDGDTFRSLGQIFEVVAKQGNTITTSSPLYHSYDASLKPQLSPTGDGTVKYAGVEDLYATRTSAGGGFLFHLINAAYSWVKNVHGEKTDGRSASVETSYRCVVRDSYFNDAWDLTPGGSAYGITLDRHSSDNLIENNIVIKLNIPITFQVSSGGNVVAYNYVDDALQSDSPGWNTAGIRGHCSYPYMELVEGNWTNQGAMDNIHGGAGYITFYRNYFSGQRSSYDSDGNRFAMDLEANQLYMNVVGNVLWTSGVNGTYETNCDDNAVYHLSAAQAGDCEPIDRRVEDTLLRHGNFDYVNNDVVWDPDVSDHTLVPSLYLTSKPSFFGNADWPPMDPEAAAPVGTLPAKQRYEDEFSN